MIRHLMEWLFPRKCILCRSLLSKSETDLCTKCRLDQPEYPYGRKKTPFIADLTAVWRYTGDVRKSLHRYKFGKARHYAAVYGRLLAMRILRDLPQADIITWVPVSRKRLRQRGYDQVRLLAEAVSPELGIPAEPLLDKFRDNQPNSGLKTPEERRPMCWAHTKPSGRSAFAESGCCFWTTSSPPGPPPRNVPGFC